MSLRTVPGDSPTQKGQAMLKVMLMMKRKPGLSLEEFIDHYERVHVPLALTNARNLVHYERHSWGNNTDDITQPVDILNLVSAQ